jgi:RNA polymerase sigma-54 factor
MGVSGSMRLQLRVGMVPGAVQLLRLLGCGQGEVDARVEAALAENPMLERGPPRPVREVEGVVRPFDTLEAEAGCEVRSDCRAVLPIVIAHLTERGLLDAAAGEIAERHGIPAHAVEEAIRAIKVVGPAGVAETSIPAMLLAQAQQLDDALVVEIVREHLGAVADDDAERVAKALGVPLTAVRKAFQVVRTRLRPSVLDTAPPVRQVPDVFVTRELEVEVADSRWFGIQRVERLADPSARAWLAEYERAANLLIQQIDTRAAVLQRVATAAVRRQAAFFERGPDGHVPLARTDVAAELGLHPSTVSRAVAGKMLRCPNGTIVPLADLFGGAVAVKARIAELTRHQRMSDQRLTEVLAADGFRVARRTVAKYRAELGIAATGRG